MKLILSLSLLLLSQFSLAQIKFEKAYYIDNENSRHEVLIKNGDWLNNPSEFTFKDSENSQEVVGNTSNVKEFGVDGYKKLVRYKGNIDYSTDELSKLSLNKNPEYRQKEVFLYELVSGKMNLYSYRDKDVVRYFYSKAGNEITELEYKRYYGENDQTMMITNSHYKKQLEMAMADNPEVAKKLKHSNYSSQDLTKIFNQYNDIILESSKGKLNLRVRPGVTFSNVNVSEDQFLIFSKLDYGTKVGFRIGMELEWILPFNKNKWGLIFEPTFMNYKGTASYQSYTSTVKYSTLDLALGMRHYFFINDNSKLFVNGQLLMSSTFKKDSEVEIIYQFLENYSSETKLDVSSRGASFAFGVGYNYKRLSVEARINTKRNITSDYANWLTKFNYNSIVLGYNIF
ncbi:hypothetical protein PQ459_11280 [Chryseobacterium sp. KACC 21268]|nr:hypothetical protein PQ459_11280 [Chryseobacterium sp. KACC 21268]